MELRVSLGLLEVVLGMVVMLCCYFLTFLNSSIRCWCVLGDCEGSGVMNVFSD